MCFYSSDQTRMNQWEQTFAEGIFYGLYEGILAVSIALHHSKDFMAVYHIIFQLRTILLWSQAGKRDNVDPIISGISILAAGQHNFQIRFAYGHLSLGFVMLLNKIVKSNKMA